MFFEDLIAKGKQSKSINCSVIKNLHERLEIKINSAIFRWQRKKQRTISTEYKK